jgi:enoyl-CoA hydratase/carnithine racemase
VVADTQQLGKTETKELTVTLVRHGRIAELIINGASTGQRKLNPMPPIMYPEMFERLQEFDADRNLNVLVMHGAGEEAFTVGGDLRAVGPSLNNYQDVIERYWNPNTEPLSPWVIRLGLYSIDIKKPVIAAVKGYCLGVGLMIIGQHADLVVCSEDSTFGLTEIKRGLGGGTGARANLGRYIPFRLAMKLVLTGGSVGAAEAERTGLVNEVVPKDQVFARAWELAEEIAAMPPLPIRSEKEFLKRSLDLPYSQLVGYGDAMSILNQVSQDAKEGVSAFLEKRTPNFQGR